MKMCDRCRVPGCLLNYNGKACANARAEYCPDVIYTVADHIREMSDKEMATDLVEFFEELFDDGIPGPELMLAKLQKPAEEEGWGA